MGWSVGVQWGGDGGWGFWAAEGAGYLAEEGRVAVQVFAAGGVDDGTGEGAHAAGLCSQSGVQDSGFGGGVQCLAVQADPGGAGAGGCGRVRFEVGRQGQAAVSDLYDATVE